ncbi:RagB/SusD family nutrient uptake outer membrane protein [Flammeovirga pacifica]|uniref:RagB/SusD family nutrient uptake outer membrane protein n=1 Tax=Flammeovirga pacifica TaxID=915059 RepID=A0A1S1YTG7_FLAPC|nr:RagB/SusD family nutrient uptake outer membrane protein [Flammeovirga pacifica]OHX64153.1 hypothetical protein NH26_21345 [Flammeovirga pacifica]
MKLRNKLVAVLLAVASLSCSKLDLVPHDELSDGSYWVSKNDFELAANSCYRELDGKYKMFWVNSQDIFQGGLIDLMTGGIYGSNEIGEGIHQPDNYFLNQIWRETYTGIRKCNNFLDKTETYLANNNMTWEENDILEAIGQVRLIRASQYYRLAKMWGDSPMPEHILTAEEANSIPATGYDAIIEKVIEEFTQAAKELQGFDGDGNRVTEYSAYAYMVRIYMDMEDWTKASEYAKKIIDSGNYELYTDGGPQNAYFDLFTTKGNNCKEAIVAHNFTNTTWSYSHGTFEQASMWGLQRPSARGTEIFWSDQGQFIEYVDATTGESLTKIEPEDQLIIDAVGKDVRPINRILAEDELHILEENRDPRYKQMMVPFEGFTSDAWSTQNATNEQVTQGRFIKGFDEAQNVGYLYSTQKHVIRLAEMFLSYAEAQNELGNGSVAVQYVNMIRDRVGMTNLTGTPQQDQLREIIRRERSIELMSEGQLYYDYKRWTFQGQNYLEYTTNRNGGVHPGGWETVELDNGKKGVDMGVKLNMNNIRSYNSPRNDYWPFPMTEVQINPNLPQKQGW